LGQVLIYPYYTANGGNSTLLSVVNTTDSAKAVKVRFLEGFNSREVLDFNLYLSHHDVWVAGIINDFPLSDEYTPSEWDTPTTLVVTDDSCTVPYLYGDYPYELDSGLMAGTQPFRDFAYADPDELLYDLDGGPTDKGRAAEGHFEIIEMGTIEKGSPAETAITHKKHAEVKKDGEVVTPAYWGPGDCETLVEWWTLGGTGEEDGLWAGEALKPGGNLQASKYTMRNSGGLFGGAAIINVNNGAMFSYDAKAIQGYDKTADGLHYIPGNDKPSLDSGNQFTAYVFFGVPQNKSVALQYDTGVDAVSAVFMHEYTMNEYTTADSPAEAATEWVITFPTKAFYVDRDFIDQSEEYVYQPMTGGLDSDGDVIGIPACNYWTPGYTYPTTTAPDTDTPIPGEQTGSPVGPFNNPGWTSCQYVKVALNVDPTNARPPFTEFFDGGACEEVTLVAWDRDERKAEDPDKPGSPPVVSPAPPPKPGDKEAPFKLCNETNILRFGERSIFDTPAFDDQSLLVTVSDEKTEGWAQIDYFADTDHEDSRGLVGLPVTGFAAQQFENGYLQNEEGLTVKAFYGGTFQHKGNVRKIKPNPHKHYRR
jgi:hypothetical protein